MVKIIALGFLTKYVGGSVIEVKLDSPKRVRDILDIPPEAQNRVIILVNNSPGTFDSIVDDDDTITIMPVIGGG
ncbi:MAG: MoaD/ThiS family protein [archaeon GBS-70-058]|nr:MoaD/ThiS family protein [Candidatus Culexarchaeum nevadense]